MKLPAIKSTNLNQPKLIKEKYKIVSEDKKLESFSRKLDEINEITIFLSKNLNAYDINETFYKDVKYEYAEQYLEKLQILPTKALINKLLALRPLEQCDFSLSIENVTINGVEKQMKIIRIYPGACVINKKKRLNQSEDNKQNNIKSFLAKNIESTIKKQLRGEDQELKDKIANIKRNNKSEVDKLIYNKEKVDDILNKNLDDIAELKLFSQKNPINVNLSFENIKKKYINIKKFEDRQTNEKTLNNKGKFYNISNSISGQKNILNDPKYAFDITTIKSLNNDIIKEVNEPIDVQLELVMKDINYILDNFPMDKFINIDEDLNINKNITDSPKRANSQDNKSKNKMYKISLDKQEDIMKIYKVFHSMDFYRLVCLALNLIYWVVFGNQNNVQIDQNTKEYLYLKLLSQIELINSKIPDIKLLSKVFIPLEIIFMRIESDNYLSRKFVLLFDDKNQKNKDKIMQLVNNIISSIFDKHGYMNSFETICGSKDEFNKKISKNLLPRFKRKIYGTSNMIEQLFSNDKSNVTKGSLEDIKERKEFILGPKVEFFNSYLEKINDKLKRRNLDPIFTLSNNRKKIVAKKTDDIIDKTFKRDLYLSTLENNQNKTTDNEGYTNLEQYMDNSVKKFKKLILKPIHVQSQTPNKRINKTELNTQSTK